MRQQSRKNIGAKVVLSFLMSKKRSSPPLPHRIHRKSADDRTIPLDLIDGGPAAGGSEGGNKADEPAVTAPSDQPVAIPSQPEEATVGSVRAPAAPLPSVAARPTKTQIHKAKLKEKGCERFHYEGPAALKESIKRIAACMDVCARVIHVMVDEEGVRVMERRLRRKGKLP